MNFKQLGVNRRFKTMPVLLALVGIAALTWIAASLLPLDHVTREVGISLVLMVLLPAALGLSFLNTLGSTENLRLLPMVGLAASVAVAVTGLIVTYGTFTQDNFLAYGLGFVLFISVIVLMVWWFIGFFLIPAFRRPWRSVQYVGVVCLVWSTPALLAFGFSGVYSGEAPSSMLALYAFGLCFVLVWVMRGMGFAKAGPALEA